MGPRCQVSLLLQQPVGRGCCWAWQPGWTKCSVFESLFGAWADSFYDLNPAAFITIRNGIGLLFPAKLPSTRVSMTQGRPGPFTHTSGRGGMSLIPGLALEECGRRSCVLLFCLFPAPFLSRRRGVACVGVSAPGPVSWLSSSCPPSALERGRKWAKPGQARGTDPSSRPRTVAPWRGQTRHVNSGALAPADEGGRYPRQAALDGAGK